MMTRDASRAFEERRGAAARFALAPARRREHDPSDVDLGATLEGVTGSGRRSRSRCRRQCAPRQRSLSGCARFSRSSEEHVGAGRRRGTTLTSDGGVRRRCEPSRSRPPTGRCRRVDVFELLSILEGVHRHPEAVVLVGREPPFRHEALEWLTHELLARAQVVEDLLLEDEEAAVDPDRRSADVLDRR